MLPELAFEPDHLRIRLGLAGWLVLGPVGLLFVRRRLLVPYASIAGVEVRPPELPPVRPMWFSVGGRGWSTAGGVFYYGGRRRFVWVPRGSPDQALVLHLRDHPFTDVTLGVPDPAQAAAELRLRGAAPDAGGPS